MIRKFLHGSSKIIQFPRFGAGEPYNDYGLGFYCTENMQLAEEWALNTRNGRVANGFVNKYSIETNGLRIIDLTSPQYTALHWLSVLLNYRIFDMSSSIASQAADYIQTSFAVDIQNCDIMIGHRADNSNFYFAQSFLNGLIDYKVFRQSVMQSNTGKQIVMKSNRAFDKLIFDGYDIANGPEIIPRSMARDRKALEIHYGINSRHSDFDVFTIVKEEVTQYDSRIR